MLDTLKFLWDYNLATLPLVIFAVFYYIFLNKESKYFQPKVLKFSLWVLWCGGAFLLQKINLVNFSDLFLSISNIPHENTEHIIGNSFVFVFLSLVVLVFIFILIKSRKNIELTSFLFFLISLIYFGLDYIFFKPDIFSIISHIIITSISVMFIFLVKSKNRILN